MLQRSRVVIIGGGISGLAAAYRLCELSQAQQVPIDVTVLEGTGRFGGLIDTQQRDGFLLEAGPDAFITEKPWALDLCRRLGLAGDLIETRPDCRRSFVVQKGRLVGVPEGWFLLAPSSVRALFSSQVVSFRGKLRMACEPLIPKRQGSTDESVAQFVRRRFGQEAFQRVAQPMISGIYSADPENLSLAATLPKFLEMEQTHGSVFRALKTIVNGKARGSQSESTRTASGPRYSLFVSLRQGMGKLIDTLVARLERLEFAHLRRSQSVNEIIPREDSTWQIKTAGNASYDADILCLALPAHQAAGLVFKTAADLARNLAAIRYESVATVNVAFRSTDVPRAVDGFGFVVPAIERRHLLGCSFSSVKFPQRAADGMVLMRVFAGGALHRDVFHLDEEPLKRLLKDELATLLGIDADPIGMWVHRHAQAMPQYSVGHLDRLALIEQQMQRYRGLFLTGNWAHGLGLPDCIHQAECLAQRMFDFRLVAGTLNRSTRNRLNHR